MDLESNILEMGFNWSVEIIIITALTIVLILGIIISFYSSWPVNLSLLKYATVIIILSVVIIPALYTPIRLSVTNEKIILRRIAGKIEINLDNVYSVAKISKREISHSIRTFGSGGLFGYLGQFRNKLIGDYTMYATERQNLVYITATKGKYIFSCSKPHEFIELVNKKTKNHK